MKRDNFHAIHPSISVEVLHSTLLHSVFCLLSVIVEKALDTWLEIDLDLKKL
jgi:hypothetical protein